MSGRKRELSEEESVLWRRVAASVKRRAGKAKPEPPSVATAKTSPSKKPMRAPPPAPAKRTAAAPIDRGAESKVRRGKVEVAARLDLHGLRQGEALDALTQFLRREHGRGSRAVLVITGVGRTGEGVLKKRVRQWLELDGFSALVSGFAAAHRSHGGAGAVYVFLRRK